MRDFLLGSQRSGKKAPTHQLVFKAGITGKGYAFELSHENLPYTQRSLWFVHLM
jgi:hypothetical protein